MKGPSGEGERRVPRRSQGAPAPGNASPHRPGQAGLIFNLPAVFGGGGGGWGWCRFCFRLVLVLGGFLNFLGYIFVCLLSLFWGFFPPKRCLPSPAHPQHAGCSTSSRKPTHSTLGMMPVAGTPFPSPAGGGEDTHDTHSLGLLRRLRLCPAGSQPGQGASFGGCRGAGEIWGRRGDFRKYSRTRQWFG